jgi:hypothetical protein
VPLSDTDLPRVRARARPVLRRLKVRILCTLSQLACASLGADDRAIRRRNFGAAVSHWQYTFSQRRTFGARVDGQSAILSPLRPNRSSEIPAVVDAVDPGDIKGRSPLRGFLVGATPQVKVAQHILTKTKKVVRHQRDHLLALGPTSCFAGSYRSISPITMSIEPTMAGMSAISQLAEIALVTLRFEKQDDRARTRKGTFSLVLRPTT